MVKQNRRRSGPTVVNGKYWIASGVVAAGLGAAMMTTTATALASPAESGSSGDSTSQNGDSTSTSEQTRESSPEDRATEADSESAGQDDDADGAGDETDRDSDDLVDQDGEDEDARVEDADTDEPDTDEPDTDDPDTDGTVEVELDDTAIDDTAIDDTAENQNDTGADESLQGLAAVPAARKENDRGTDLDAGAATTKAAPAGEPESSAVSAARTALDPPAADDTLQATVAATVAAPARITVGSMIVDMLYSIGIRNTGLGADFLAIPVPRFIESWWQGVRTRIYRDVVPDPEPEPDDGPATNPPDPTGPADPDLLWESNFTDMSEALRYWGLQTGRWGAPAGENQYYTDGDNVYIDADGNLVIDARREAAPDGLGAPHNYTSARVVTYGKQSVGVGTRVVARIQMPVTQGSLPAFWSVGLEPGHEFDWPRQGEIDIVEIPGLGTPQSRRVWTGNIHGPADTNNSVDVKLHGIDADLGVDLSQGFHEYGMDWYSDRIVWHVDGVEVGSVTQAQYEALGGDWTPFSGAWDHYLILNVAVGNPWTGDPNPAAPFQAQMKVDWVKAYQL